MRRAARRDDIEAEIVGALRRVGISVFRVSALGLPDLLTFSTKRGWLPIEVKARGETLTAAQREVWNLTRFPIVSSIEDALKLWGIR